MGSLSDLGLMVWWKNGELESKIETRFFSMKKMTSIKLETNNQMRIPTTNKVKSSQLSVENFQPVKESPFFKKKKWRNFYY